MLVLKRSKGDTVVLNGGEFVIKVLSCSRGGVRLGFDGSREIKVDRGEYVPTGDEPDALRRLVQARRKDGQHALPGTGDGTGAGG